MINSGLPQKDGFLFLITDDDTLVIQGKRINECIEYINNKNITSISIDSIYYKLNDINFLAECPNVESVGIGESYINDYSGLTTLKKLKSLSLNEPDQKIDLSTLDTIENLWGFWNKNIHNIGLCNNLKRLKLWKYKSKDNNIMEFSKLDNLEELTLTQSTITSLKGCGGINALTKLELNYLRNFEYIDEIEKNADTLKELRFHSCKKIKNHEYVKCLHDLEWLTFGSCGNIQSIEFIKELPKLKKFTFVETNIIDGDLSPCIGLEFVGFNDKKHYSHKFKELNPSIKL
jgi:hypothetical protein